MKKIVILLALLLVLTGCKNKADTASNDVYDIDTPKTPETSENEPENSESDEFSNKYIKVLPSETEEGYIYVDIFPAYYVNFEPKGVSGNAVNMDNSKPYEENETLYEDEHVLIKYENGYINFYEDGELFVADWPHERHTPVVASYSNGMEIRMNFALYDDKINAMLLSHNIKIKPFVFELQNLEEPYKTISDLKENTKVLANALNNNFGNEYTINEVYGIETSDVLYLTVFLSKDTVLVYMSPSVDGDYFVCENSWQYVDTPDKSRTDYINETFDFMGYEDFVVEKIY